MLVSEGIIRCDDHPGHSLGSSNSNSTFLGRPDRGGWRPIIAIQQTDDENIKLHFVIDWVCPTCKRLIAESRTCPSCGLELLTEPVEMRPRASRDKISKMKFWIEQQLEIDDTDASRISGEPNKRSEHSSSDQGQSSHATTRR